MKQESYLFLAGGCFWCIADVFLKTPGVIDVISGYSGGNVNNPTYEEVKSQTTGHRETIKIIYDPKKINILEILNIYFSSVDPFDQNGQYIDKGFSYTLCLFYQDDHQKEIFTNFLKEKQTKYNKKIYIALEPLKNFFLAEEYHQKFSIKNPEAFKEELIISKRKK